MYVITFEKKPATIAQIYTAEGRKPHWRTESGGYLAAATKKEAVELFLYHIGFTWKERAKGIGCRKVSL